jgi:hypothetical protein
MRPTRIPHVNVLSDFAARVNLFARHAPNPQRPFECGRGSFRFYGLNPAPKNVISKPIL